VRSVIDGMRNMIAAISVVVSAEIVKASQFIVGRSP
jgi:hypothetical protein